MTFTSQNRTKEDSRNIFFLTLLIIWPFNPSAPSRWWHRCTKSDVLQQRQITEITTMKRKSQIHRVFSSTGASSSSLSYQTTMSLLFLIYHNTYFRPEHECEKKSQTYLSHNRFAVVCTSMSSQLYSIVIILETILISIPRSIAKEFNKYSYTYV